MTPEAQRIAIAKACGWKDLETRWECYHQWQAPCGLIKFGKLSDKYACLPDYLHDLNAMHEAENIILEKHGHPKFCAYENELEVISDLFPIHATAAQRAEAFLRTLNLYTP